MYKQQRGNWKSILFDFSLNTIIQFLSESILSIFKWNKAWFP